MAAQNILESTVYAIKDQIENNIATYLGEVRSARTDGKVTTEPPKSYFVFEDSATYKSPAVFIIADNVDYQTSRGQNHINAKVTVYVSLVIEDRTQNLLTLKAWRYQDALHKCLDRQHLISGPVQNIVKVIRAELSRDQSKKMSSTETIFRKEIMLTLDVEHYQKEN